MNKAEWKATAERQLDTTFINSIMDNVKENLGKLIYEAKKQCLEREPTEADEKRFHLTVVGGSELPKSEFHFDDKLVGHIEQKEFHGLDMVGNNYTVTLEYIPIR
jgi:hypothetical protein